MRVGGLTGISNGLHLVHIKVVDNGIKTGVEVIEKVNHLQRSAGSSNTCEPHNVTESEGHHMGEGLKWSLVRGGDT